MTVQRALWLEKRYLSTLMSVFLTGFRYFSIKQLPNYFLTSLSGSRSRHCTLRKMFRVQPGIEPWTSWMAFIRANHYIKEVVTPLRLAYIIQITRLIYLICHPTFRVEIFQKLKKVLIQRSEYRWVTSKPRLWLCMMDAVL